MALCQEADARRNHEIFNGRNVARTPLSTATTPIRLRDGPAIQLLGRLETCAYTSRSRPTRHITPTRLKAGLVIQRSSRSETSASIFRSPQILRTTPIRLKDGLVILDTGRLGANA